MFKKKFDYFIHKIPKHITIFYLKTKNIIILKFKNKTRIIYNDNFFLTIIQNSIVTLNFSNIFSLKVKLYLIEIEFDISKKIQLFGIGYKIFEITILTKKILLLKLGFSHFIYCKIPKKFKLFVVKSVQLCVNCNSFYNIIFNLAIIKSYKKPDVFKGKGFKFPNEQIKLKLGKKV